MLGSSGRRGCGPRTLALSALRFCRRGSVPGAHHLGPVPGAEAEPDHSDYMSMGMVLIIAAVAIFFRGRIRDYALARADNPTRMRYSGPITVVFGAVLGVLVSLCSVGAGALAVA